MKLPYTRYIKQITTDTVPNTQWLALQSRAFELLKVAPWVRTDVDDSEFPLNDPLTFKLSEKYDAFKASTAQSGSGKQSCSMGCAVYLFKVPSDAITNSKFWTSLSLMISADKFCVSGLRIVTALMGTPGGSPSYEQIWDGILAQWPNPTLPAPQFVSATNTDEKGSYGLLAARENLITSSSNKATTYTLSLPDFQTPANYIAVLIGLQDYTTIRVDSTGKQTREYWIEGSGNISGIMADFTFTSTVTPDASGVDESFMRKVCSSESGFYPYDLRTFVDTPRYDSETPLKVLPIEIFRMAIGESGVVAGQTSNQFVPARIETETGYKSAYAAILDRCLGTMKNDDNPHSGTAQMAIPHEHMSLTSDQLLSGDYKLTPYGLISTYVVPATAMPQLDDYSGRIPQIISSVLGFNVATSSPTKSLRIVNSGARTTNGATVRLSAWFVASGAVPGVARPRFQRIARALASSRAFWLGSEKTVSASDISEAFGTFNCGARLLGSVDLPESIATGAEFEIPCSLDANTSGWIVFAPFVVSLPRGNVMFDDAFDLIPAPGDPEDNFRCWQVGLGHEIIAGAPKQMVTYRLDYQTKEFGCIHDQATVGEGTGVFYYGPCRGWVPDIYLY